MKSMLRNAIGVALATQKIAAVVSQQTIIPIPQQALNLTLPYFYKDIPEIQSLQVTVHEGYFMASVRIKKFVEAETTLRFEVVETKLTADEQFISLKQTGNSGLRGDSLVGKVVLLIVDAIFTSIMDIDPVQYAAQKHSGIKVNDGVYTIDLGLLGIKNWLTQHPNVERMLTVAHINELRCTEGAFQAVPGIDLTAPKQHLSNLFNIGKKDQ